MAHAIESSLATPNTTAVFLVDLASAPSFRRCYRAHHVFEYSLLLKEKHGFQEV